LVNQAIDDAMDSATGSGAPLDRQLGTVTIRQLLTHQVQVPGL
jgi:hypothetical protein